MLNHPTHDRLIALGLAGMAKAFEEQRSSPDLGALSFEESVGIMGDRKAADEEARMRRIDSFPVGMGFTSLQTARQSVARLDCRSRPVHSVPRAPTMA